MNIVIWVLGKMNTVIWVLEEMNTVSWVPGKMNRISNLLHTFLLSNPNNIHWFFKMDFGNICTLVCHGLTISGE